MEISLTIARLSLKGPIHLSKGREDPESSGEILHADTIKSALVVAGLELYGSSFQPEGFLDEVIISSVFPFFKEELFFPRPMTRLPFRYEGVEGEARIAKKVKKLKYLGLTYFEKCLNAEETMIPEVHQLDKGAFISDKVLQESIVLSGRPASLIGKDLQQRVNIPKPGSDEDSNTFYVERIYYHPKGGLFFLIHGISESSQSRLEAVLRYLGEKGIGKNRTFGFGQFEFSGFEDLKLRVPEQATSWTNLSVYCPKAKQDQSAELTKEILAASAYGLVKRGGWVSSPEKEENHGLRKRSVYMFQEGSVFPFGEQTEAVKFAGKRVNLQPDILKGTHPIWRDGKALFLPIRQTL